MNEETLKAFREWLQEQSVKADRQYLDAEENSREEEYYLGASDAFDDVIYQLDQLCQK